MTSKIDPGVWGQLAFWVLAVLTVSLLAAGWWIAALVAGVATVGAAFSVSWLSRRARVAEAMEGARRDAVSNPSQSELPPGDTDGGSHQTNRQT
jgi:uncharacterized membrane protein